MIQFIVREFPPFNITTSSVTFLIPGSCSNAAVLWVYASGRFNESLIVSDAVRACSITFSILDHSGLQVYAASGQLLDEPVGLAPPDRELLWRGVAIPDGTGVNAHSIAVVPEEGNVVAETSCTVPWPTVDLPCGYSVRVDLFGAAFIDRAVMCLSFDHRIKH